MSARARAHGGASMPACGACGRASWGCVGGREAGAAAAAAAACMRGEGGGEHQRQPLPTGRQRRRAREGERERERGRGEAELRYEGEASGWLQRIYVSPSPTG